MRGSLDLIASIFRWAMRGSLDLIASTKLVITIAALKAVLMDCRMTGGM